MIKYYNIRPCLSLAILILSISACSTHYAEPDIPLDQYQLEEDFRIEVIASEPLIQAPVAMDFDIQGRIWVVEMPGYMPDIDGTGEELPTGRISILEDLDEDGRMDHSKTFLDSLILPRALALVHDGLLYAEPPNLWFVAIEHDQPGKRILVDSIYADGGNVEHMPNGLHRNIDNWIYNANANFRYRRINGQWKKEATAYRGQWGITHDDMGRLFYNDNSNQLQGDMMPPNLFSRNPHLRVTAGLKQQITTNQRLYPSHVTSVNRGYMDGVLDEEGKVKHFTSACGPLIYRGDQFPEEYYGNAFVCAPEANLVKRNIISRDGARIEAQQAYEGREFLAATEETFRPVNLHNGPDGTLYVLDMHKGIIQHRAYMTTYLREQLIAKGLDTLISKGRVLRVVYKNKPVPTFLVLSTMSDPALVELLYHPNGWIRDKVQQLLVERKAQDMIPRLQQMITDTHYPLTQIHALWTLEGLGKITPDLLSSATADMDDRFLSHVIRLAEAFTNNGQIQDQLQTFSQLKNPLIDLQLALSLGQSVSEDSEPNYNLLSEIMKRYPGDRLFLEAALSGMKGQEASFKDFLLNIKSFERNDPAIQLIDQTIKKAEEIPAAGQETAFGTQTDRRTQGMQLFRTNCATCHGMGGEGIDNLAPPLAGSDYVEGATDRLILITLHGLSGPIHINGERYELNAVMPGVKENPNLSDDDIASILTFVKNAFAKNPVWINPKRVAELREEAPEGYSFTEEKLNKKVKTLVQ